MDKLYIICVDDQREVLSTLSEDLEPFEGLLRIEECESVKEAWEVMDTVDSQGDYVALVITDQVMPGNSGVDLLKKMSADPRYEHTRKVLLTGLATHQDTIEAINAARLDNYIEKPWNRETLHRIIRVLITKYLLSQGLEYKEYLPILDQKTLYAMLRKTT